MHRFHREAGPLPHVPQQGHVAPALVSEVEVVAHHDDTSAELGHEHLGHEVLGSLLGALGVEGQNENLVDSGSAEKLEFLVEIGEPRRRRGWIDHRGRILVERHDDTAQPGIGSPLAHLFDHPAMADVHPVVRPDGHGAAVVVSHRGGTLLVVGR